MNSSRCFPRGNPDLCDIRTGPLGSLDRPRFSQARHYTTLDKLSRAWNRPSAAPHAIYKSQGWGANFRRCRKLGRDDLLPIRRSRGAIDKRFVEYLLELTDGVTGRIIDVLGRTALQALTNGAGKVDLEQLQRVGARLPTIVGQRT